jgi:hypothetical protein
MHMSSEWSFPFKLSNQNFVLISHLLRPRCPIKCRNWFIISEVILNWNRPGGVIRRSRIRRRRKMFDTWTKSFEIN